MPRVLAVQVSVTEYDLLRYIDTLEDSLSRLVALEAVDVRVFLVLQSSSDSPVIPDVLLINNRVHVEIINIFSASFARNLGIAYARSIGASHIMFHDSSIGVSVEFAKFAEICVVDDFVVGVGKIKWTDPALQKAGAIASVSVTQMLPSALKNPYVYTYVFRVNDLGSIGFCERLGPGTNTLFNAGEDVVFLTQLFSFLGKEKLIMHGLDAFVFHPPRPLDGAKHLAYAYAQGALLRWLIKPENLSWQVIFYFFMFFGNALVRALFFQKTWPKILVLRLRGFLSSKKFHQVVS